MTTSILQFQKPTDKTFLRIALLFSALLTSLALIQFRTQIVAEELFFTSANFRGALYFGYLGLGGLVVMTALAWTVKADWILDQFNKLKETIARLGGLSYILIFALVWAYLQLVLGFYGRFLLNAFPRLLLFWLLSVLITTLFANVRGRTWIESLPAGLLFLAALFSAATFFQQVNTYPLSLGWSEISRYYQASFFFSEQVYGQALPWPVTHPSRYLLQSLPFLLGELPLWAHRLWQALLWVGMASLTGTILIRRLGIKAKWLGIVFAAWIYIYLMQGAVFYHLLPTVILVLWGFDRRRFWRSLLIVGVASIWAGISRVNWLPMPGALAALLYLLESPLDAKGNSTKLGYWNQPIAYFLAGSLTALASYSVYISSSGVEESSQFASSFTSALLWDRLWPSVDLPIGILAGILIVSMPLLLLLWLRLRPQPGAFHRQRLLGMAGILLVFFFGGLLVSVKIGGGTNLHNLDAFMVLLLVLTSQLAFGRYEQEKNAAGPANFTLSWPTLALLLLVPILYAVLNGAPLELPNQDNAEKVLAQIQEMVTESLEDGNEVLFISQRHLLTFNLVDAPLVHDYEKLFLMEMAISHNDAYLVRFVEDMKNQRFGLIITDPLYRNIREDSEDSLAAENNEWVRSVSRPVLCAYEPALTLTELTLQILEPRNDPNCR